MMIVHACLNKTPSGSFRAAIGAAQLGELCSNCGVKMTEHIELKVSEVKV